MASPPSLSLQTSHSTSIPDSTDYLSMSSAATRWTDEQEARLQYCEAELAKAHKRWSASQELWLEEYRCLQTYEKQVDYLRALKKAHLKALKKQQAQATKAVGIWKKKTWKTLSRTSSRVDTTITTPVDTEADDEGEDDEVGDDALSPIERTDSMPDPPTSPTQPSRKSSFSNAVRRLSMAGIRGGLRKASAGNSNAASASQSGAVTPALDGV